MYKCPKCGAELQEGQEVCNCGMKITWQKPKEQSAQAMPKETPIETPMESSTNNKMAEVLSGVAAFLIIIGVCAGVVLSVEASNNRESVAMGIIIIATSIVSGIFILGFSEIIQLLQDIKNKLK